MLWTTGVLSPNKLVDEISKVAQITRLNIYKNTLPLNMNGEIVKNDQKITDMIWL